MFKQYQQGNTYIWYAEEFIDDPALPIFDADYWQANQQVVGQATGRGTTWFIRLAKLDVALRHYRRGGLFGKIIRDHYWFSGINKTRCVAEVQLLEHLSAAGVHVPRPVAARVVKKHFCYQADLLSERIPNAQDLVDILQKQPLTMELYQQIGVEIGKMHQTGVDHTDLNIHNILLDNHSQVWIIDFDKCAQRFSTSGFNADSSNTDSSNVDSAKANWQQANLDRLKRSFIKEQGKRQIQWQEAEFQSLLNGYYSIIPQSPLT